MLRDLLDWFEFRASVLAFIIIRISAIYWLVVLGAKFFTREPLLYLYSGSDYTQETIPVLAVFLVQVVALVYQLMTRTVFGRPLESVVLFMLSPWIAVASILVFVMWFESGAAKGASYLPLAALSVTSVLAAVLARYGPLARGSAKARTATAIAGQAQVPCEQVTRVTRPTSTFADIHGNLRVKERLLVAGNTVMQARSKNPPSPARNGILLHGAPGNGKTAFAEALAGEMGLPLLTLSTGDVASKWVGEKTSRVRTAFHEAVQNEPCVLFVDEVDSFLESRDASGAGAVKEDRDLVNAMLTLMVDIRRSRVLLVAATNHLDRLDPAAIREGRFDFRVEVPPPDEEARLGLLRDGLRAIAPGPAVASGVIEAVARRWNGFSSKRILAVLEELPTVLRQAGRSAPEFKDFMDALRIVQGHAAMRLENVRPLHELVLSERTRLGLGNVLARMANPEYTERHGGTLPTGIIFAGLPGTGKTAAAKAMAKELGWTFLSATGAELSRGVEALNRIHSKAQDLRPAIVFVDESDELLRHREFSASTEATNKLLTILDGASDRVPDVVWIAATNHLESVDPAMLRGGRFSEKVIFELPTREALEAHVAAWLEKRDVVLESGMDIPAIIGLVGEASVATAEAVIQAALNLAISRRTVPVLVTRSDVLNAVQLVIG